MNKFEALVRLAAGVENPMAEYVVSQMKYDKMRNPYNDHHKPPLRSENEILADFKVEMAKLILDRIEKAVA